MTAAGRTPRTAAAQAPNTTAWAPTRSAWEAGTGGPAAGPRGGREAGGLGSRATAAQSAPCSPRRAAQGLAGAQQLPPGLVDTGIRHLLAGLPPGKREALLAKCSRWAAHQAAPVPGVGAGVAFNGERLVLDMFEVLHGTFQVVCHRAQAGCMACSQSGSCQPVQQLPCRSVPLQAAERGRSSPRGDTNPASPRAAQGTADSAAPEAGGPRPLLARHTDGASESSSTVAGVHSWGPQAWREDQGPRMSRPRRNRRRAEADLLGRRQDAGLAGHRPGPGSHGHGQQGPRGTPDGHCSKAVSAGAHQRSSRRLSVLWELPEASLCLAGGGPSRSRRAADLQALGSAVPLSGLDLAGPRDMHRIDLSDPLQGTGEVAACKAQLSHSCSLTESDLKPFLP